MPGVTGVEQEGGIGTAGEARIPVLKITIKMRRDALAVEKVLAEKLTDV